MCGHRCERVSSAVAARLAALREQVCWKVASCSQRPSRSAHRCRDRRTPHRLCARDARAQGFLSARIGHRIDCGTIDWRRDPAMVDSQCPVDRQIRPRTSRRRHHRRHRPTRRHAPSCRRVVSEARPGWSRRRIESPHLCRSTDCRQEIREGKAPDGCPSCRGQLYGCRSD